MDKGLVLHFIFKQDGLSSVSTAKIMTLYNNKYRIEPARLAGHDYGSNGAYHITICTKNRLHHFGEIVETDDNPSLRQNTSTSLKPSVPGNDKTDYHPSLQSTQIGQVALENWLAIPHHFPFISLDSFILMPNHIHGILFINKQENEDWKQNNFGSQSRNIPSIIRAFKGSVKRYANAENIPFEWQEKYYDRIIRDNKELENTRLYIFNNPQNWLNDEYRN